MRSPHPRPPPEGEGSLARPAIFRYENPRLGLVRGVLDVVWQGVGRRQTLEHAPERVEVPHVGAVPARRLNGQDGQPERSNERHQGQTIGRQDVAGWSSGPQPEPTQVVTKIMQGDASTLHEPRNIYCSGIAIEAMLETLHGVGPLRRAFRTRTPTRRLIITIEAF